MKINKTIGIIIFVLGGLSLLAWPILGFMSIFAFDAPFTDSFDRLCRYLSVLLILSYPVGYVIALPWFISKWRKGSLKVLHSLSGLAPIVHLTLAFVVMSFLAHIQFERQNPDLKITNNLFIEDEGSDRFVVDKNGDILIQSDIREFHYLEKQNLLIVAQAFEMSTGAAADDPITYFVINTLDNSITKDITSHELKQRYGLPDSLTLFEPEARSNEFIANNPDIHKFHQEIRLKQISNHH